MKVIIADGFFKSVKKCFRPWWHPAELWYKFKCWAWHRYSTVKPRYLPHTWCDRTEQLPHMMFEILSQFIEKECSLDIIEWFGDDGHKITVNGEEKFVRDEMQDLYDWWHTEYHKAHPARCDDLWAEITALDGKHKISDFKDTEDGMCQWSPTWDSPEAEAKNAKLMAQMNELDADMEKQLTERLERILPLRRYMWT